jgi:CxxC motif-containing protein (DUF1111 family)
LRKEAANCCSLFFVFGDEIFMNGLMRASACLLILVGLWGCSAGQPEVEQPLQQTVQASSVQTPEHHLLDQPDVQMPLLDQLDFAVGRSFFRNPWVQAPASTDARDGLGPLFNSLSCSSCHIASARGLAPFNGQSMMTHVVRLSVPGTTAEPVYGGQLQNQALPGVNAEGQAVIRFTEMVRTLKDGEQVSLRKPALRIEQLGYGELAANVQTSVRMAPMLTGLGLLEAVPEKQLLAWVDPKDANDDGISGRANQVWDVSKQSEALGRFGWKAEQPSLRQQAAGAFHVDLGISSTLFAGQNCTSIQRDCQQMVDGGEPEISDKLLGRVALYVGNLAVPKSTTGKAERQAGQALFEQAGCQQCHRAQLQAGESEHAWLSNRTFHPYTDLLLHDMGEELADNRPVFAASGREWRTAPLWGIGLAKKVAPQTGFLHDGRARNVLEAILWHGGEAKNSRQVVEQMSAAQRNELLRFIESL